MINTIILISGNGSNLQAIIDACKNNNSTHAKLPINIVAVISNKPDAYGLQRAREAGIHTEVLDHKQFENRQAFDLALEKLIDQFKPKLIALAGFMRILTDDFVNHYLGRMINIHPSLLPHFPGLNTHQQALDEDVKQHGASVHFVTPELDGGPVIIQAHVAVEKNDSAQTLQARVLEQEHKIYPIAIRWFAENRLCLKNNAAYLDNCQLEQPKK